MIIIIIIKIIPVITPGIKYLLLVIELTVFLTATSAVYFLDSPLSNFISYILLPLIKSEALNSVSPFFIDVLLKSLFS